MNKEVIKDNFEVFKFWLDGGKVWYRNIGENADYYWNILKEPEWAEAKGRYVQDDKYAEFRKALADGKVIQWECQEDKWEDLPEDYTFDNCEPEEYRIKPDELKFKVNDWIKGVYSSEITQVKENVGYPLDCWKLWEPQEGEICLFSDEEPTESYLLSKFSGRAADGRYADGAKMYWKYCQPFIGTPPKGLL